MSDGLPIQQSAVIPSRKTSSLPVRPSVRLSVIIPALMPVWVIEHQYVP